MKEKLENKCNYVIAGFEKLAEYDEEKRNEIIKNNPLIMYSVFVDNNSFEKLKVKQIETELQNLVPIANIEMLRQEAVIKSKDYIFPISVDVLQNSNPEKLEEYKSKLEKNIEGLNSKILDVKSRIDREQEYLNEVKIFEQTYSSKNIIDSLYENVDSAKSQIEKLEKEQKDLSNNIQNNNEKKEELSKENTLLEKDQKSILEEIEVLNELKNINNELQKLQDQISKEKSNEQILKESLEEKIEIVQEIEDEIRGLEKQINNLENQKNRYLIKLSELTEFEETEENLNSKLIGQKTKIKLGAGEKIAKVGMVFFKESLTGFEEIAGIPGTIGGAVRMNAGANGREMKDIIKTVKCLDYQGNEKVFTNEEMEFGYRTSILKKEKYIVTEVEIELEKGNQEEIKEKMDMYKEKRRHYICLLALIMATNKLKRFIATLLCPG